MGNRPDGGQVTEEPQLRLVERNYLFHTVQGEGTLIGTPSTFLRLHGCNQSCSWCDTKESWRPGSSYTYRPVDDVVADLRKARHDVVITGGNPMLQWGPILSLLLKIQQATDHPVRRVTIETNAYGPSTVPRDLHRLSEAVPGKPLRMLPILWSLSPKVAQHDLGVLRDYLGSARPMLDDVQVKVVVQTEEDIEPALGLLHTAYRAGYGSGLIVQPEFSAQNPRSVMTRNETSAAVAAQVSNRAWTSYGMIVRIIPQVHKTMRWP